MAPGEYDDETQLRREAPARPVRSWPELAWTDEAGTHKCAITGRTTLGSAPGAQVRIADREVSRLHAELEPTDRGTWVRDLGSRNGTSVENMLVGAALVPDGARIRVGGTEVVLRYPAAASPIELWPGESFGGLIGASTPMRELFAQMARVAQSDAPVLILGETGTGKELAARAIHDASARAAGPFVIVDCAALAELDHRRRAVRARARRVHGRGQRPGPGRSRRRNGGTIFLDEIGELPPALQPKLLRVLESRTIKRLGESEHRPIDVRLVAATHRDLRRMVNAAAFREDLYFRIAVLPLVLPPLRARKDDIAPLFRHFLAGRQTGRADRRNASSPRCRGWATCASCATSSSACARSARKDAMQSSHAWTARPAHPAAANPAAGRVRPALQGLSRALDRSGRARVPAAAAGPPRPQRPRRRRGGRPRPHVRLPPDPQARPLRSGPSEGEGPSEADALRAARPARGRAARRSCIPDPSRSGARSRSTGRRRSSPSRGRSRRSRTACWSTPRCRSSVGRTARLAVAAVLRIVRDVRLAAVARILVAVAPGAEAAVGRALAVEAALRLRVRRRARRALEQRAPGGRIVLGHATVRTGLLVGSAVPVLQSVEIDQHLTAARREQDGGGADERGEAAIRPVPASERSLPVKIQSDGQRHDPDRQPDVRDHQPRPHRVDVARRCNTDLHVVSY